MTRNLVRVVAAIVLLNLGGAEASADIPLMINHQGFILVDGEAFNGTGDFKFGIIDASNKWLWTHDGTQVDQPAGPTSIPTNNPSVSMQLEVTQGVYSVRLGDIAITGMESSLSSDVFSTDSVFLRVIFDDGTPNGEQVLDPDQRITSTAYAFHAARLTGPPNIVKGNVIVSFNGEGDTGLSVTIQTTGRPVWIELRGQSIGWKSGAVKFTFQREDSQNNIEIVHETVFNTTVLSNALRLATTSLSFTDIGEPEGLTTGPPAETYTYKLLAVSAGGSGMPEIGGNPVGGAYLIAREL